MAEAAEAPRTGRDGEVLKRDGGRICFCVERMVRTCGRRTSLIGVCCQQHCLSGEQASSRAGGIANVLLAMADAEYLNRMVERIL